MQPRNESFGSCKQHFILAFLLRESVILIAFLVFRGPNLTGRVGDGVCSVAGCTWVKVFRWGAQEANQMVFENSGDAGMTSLCRKWPMFGKALCYFFIDISRTIFFVLFCFQGKNSKTTSKNLLVLLSFFFPLSGVKN